MEVIEDEVDVIVENMTTILPILGKIVTRGMRAKTHLSPQIMQTMQALTFHGQLTMSGIGIHLSIPKPQVTALIDKLVAEEMVERLSDENDRRIIYIRLTDKGEKTFCEIKKMISESLRSTLLQIDTENLGRLKESSTELSVVLQEIRKMLQMTHCQNNDCKNE